MRAGIAEALSLVATAEKLYEKALGQSFWLGVRRARKFYGDGPLKRVGAAVYYYVGRTVYPLILRIVSPKRLI